MIHWVEMNELQDYLDKYQDKIKFITLGAGGRKYMLIIDEA